ncbi:MAG: ParB/RepB/Spo0J family partition protein [Tissierellaceae bacterium]|jgi:ParB family chromosome partitioning protein
MKKVETFNIADMFGLPSESRPETGSKEEVLISKLVPFRNHPFKLYDGERLNDMVESIKEHGVITPLIVRPLNDDKYEILSGHNRANSAKLAGLETVPVVIKEGLTDEEAMLIVTETNLIQRSFSELSHSEKARILTERHKAIKEQGRKTDLIKEIEMLSRADDLEENSTFGKFGQNENSREKVANKYDLSSRNVARYLRIDTLIEGLKPKIDSGEIPFTAGVDLSFLKKEEQEIVLSILEEFEYKINLKKSNELKKLSQKRTFNEAIALKILSGEYFEKSKVKKRSPRFTSKFTRNIVEKYFDEDTPIKEIERIIEELLEEYYERK